MMYYSSAITSRTESSGMYLEYTAAPALLPAENSTMLPMPF